MHVKNTYGLSFRSVSDSPCTTTRYHIITTYITTRRDTRHVTYQKSVEHCFGVLELYLVVNSFHQPRSNKTLNQEFKFFRGSTIASFYLTSHYCLGPCKGHVGHDLGSQRLDADAHRLEFRSETLHRRPRALRQPFDRRVDLLVR